MKEYNNRATRSVKPHQRCTLYEAYHSVTAALYGTKTVPVTEASTRAVDASLETCGDYHDNQSMAHQTQFVVRSLD